MDMQQLTTPALVVQSDLLDANLTVMSDALPGRRLRPHVKAHKCTRRAARQAELGHSAFTCSTIGEMEGMARVGLGDDLLFCSDEHLTFAPDRAVQVGDRINVLPAHVDPTVAYHEHLHVLDGEEVVETWPVDLRGW